MTQAERQEAFFARADRAHRAAAEQLRDSVSEGNARAWRARYVAAFTKYWFMDGAAQSATLTDAEPGDGRG